MIKTYRMACSWRMMQFLEVGDHILADWEELEPEYSEAGNLYEFSAEQPLTKFLKHIVVMQGAEEQPCAHQYGIDKDQKIKGDGWGNVCRNCGKILATFGDPNREMGYVRRIWFRGRKLKWR